MSVQPVPPTGSPTTAGQLAARATANDQALAAWLGDVEDQAANAAARAEILAPTADRGVLTFNVPSLEG